MILDNLGKFCTAQAITASSVQSTDVVPLGPVLRSIASGSPLFIDVNMTEAFVGDGTLLIHTWIDVGTSIAATALFTGSTGVYTAAAGNILSVNMLPLGGHITIPVMPLSAGQIAWMQAVSSLAGLPYAYMGMQFELSSGTFSAGKLTAGFVADPKSVLGSHRYADAVN